MDIVKTIVITVVLAFMSKFMYFWLVDNGYGVHFYNVQPGPCRVVPGIECGSEKVSVTHDGLAFITNGFKLITNCNQKYLRGHIYLFDFNQPEKNVSKLIIQSDTLDLKAFGPHGMDIYEDLEQGNVKVYVVNHAKKIESVEVFHYHRSNPQKLIHLDTIMDDKFICLNDITVIDENRFYITNSMKYCHSRFAFGVTEIFLKLKTASIVYYDHGKSIIVADGESFLNGIALSKDKTQVFSVAFSSGGMFIYDRDENNGKLDLRNKFFVGHHPDNIFTDLSTGHLYVGIQKEPYTLAAASMSNNTGYFSSSGIKLKTKSEKWDDFEIEEVFHHDGKNVVSSVAYYKGHYLFGTVFHKLAYCRERKEI